MSPLLKRALNLGVMRHKAPWVLDRSIGTGFGLAVTVLLAAAGVTIYSTTRTLHAANRVTHEQEVLKEIEEVSSGVTSVESSQRGFVITADESMRQNRDEHIKMVAQDLDDIRVLVPDDSVQSNLLGRLAMLVERRNTFGDQAIESRRNLGFAAAQAMVLAGGGSALSSRINELIQGMRQHEYQRLDGYRHDAAAAANTTYLLLPLGVLLSIGIHCIGLRLLNAGMQAEKASAAALVAEMQRTAAAGRERDVAEAASRMKSLFLSTMSHELRTPLNGIIGFTELLSDERPGPLNPKQRQFVGEVLGSSRHLLKMIDDVLSISRIEAGSMVPEYGEFDLRPVIDEVCDSLEPIAKESRIGLIRSISPTAGLMRLDRRMLRMAVLNLVSNGIKFTNPGGLVEIQAEVSNGNLQLRVVDTGIGIRSEDFSRLFVDFQQLDTGPNRKFEGTGLGLYLAKRLVELQGGTISVESELGIGTRFIVILPLSPKTLLT